jgi:hypothetical protein
MARQAETAPVQDAPGRTADEGTPSARTPNSGPYHLEPLSASEAERWDEITAPYETRELFHRRTWLEYLASSRGAQIRLWRICAGDESIGYFCAGLLRKGPFRILGSPLRGWGTNFMGPIVHADVDQERLLDALDRLCGEEGVAMMEIEHPLFEKGNPRGHGYEPIPAATYVVELHADLDVMWSTLSSNCRNRIRKAKRLGLRVEETRECAVADEFYDQFEAVMRRQWLVPSYPRETARLLVRHLGRVGLLFSLRVLDAQGRVLAIGLFPHDERTVYFWGGAGVHDGRDACPNELLHWDVMRRAAEQGLTRYNMCGDGRFKRKFGGAPVSVNRWRKYYWPGARTAHRAYELYHRMQISLRGSLAGVWLSQGENSESVGEASPELGAATRIPRGSGVVGDSGEGE